MASLCLLTVDTSLVLSQSVSVKIIEVIYFNTGTSMVKIELRF